LYVPNNAGDLMVAAWARGNPDASMAEHRTEKDVRPTRFAGPDGRPLASNPDFLPVHFDWPLTPEQYAAGEAHRETLRAAARSITHLGWGVDQAVGHAELLPGDPPGDPASERWRPEPAGGGTPLRVPRAGTLAELRRKHADFLGRLRHGSFDPVPPLPESAFAVVGYRRATDPAGRPWVAFRIVSVDPDDPKNPAFDPSRKCRDVAAWVRSATARVCQEWPDMASFIHGHDADGSPLKGDAADSRFMYLPLPTINPALNRVESIRRVLIAGPPGAEDRIDWVRRRLPGQVLTTDPPDRREIGLLTEHTGNPWVLEQYTGSGRVWSTVTPVVLPGYDDPDHLRRRLRDNGDAAVQRRLLAQLNGRIEGLLRKALRQAGLADEVATAAVLDWRSVGFRPGVDPARHYLRPENLGAFPAYHVRVRFATPIPGPLVVGAGRYRGFGLFAIEDERIGR
jgi:CRISPR-associated protein Csb2